MTPERKRTPTVHGIGGRIRDARMAAGMTQAQLAEAAGVSRATLAQVESGRHGPNLAALVAFADALGVTTDSLLGRSSTP